MKYLFLVYGNRSPDQDASSSDQDAFVQACREYDQALRESGYLLAGVGFPEDEIPTLVRVRNGELSLPDVPSMEMQVPLVALLMIDARDLNEAVRVAARMPQAKRGSIVIRPASELDLPCKSTLDLTDSHL